MAFLDCIGVPCYRRQLLSLHYFTLSLITVNPALTYIAQSHDADIPLHSGKPH